jgi:hypothetical protein
VGKKALVNNAMGNRNWNLTDAGGDAIREAFESSTFPLKARNGICRQTLFKSDISRLDPFSVQPSFKETV